MPQRTMKDPRSKKVTRNKYTIFDDQTVGTVQITEDVLATIAAIAATDVEGVAAVGSSITREKAARMSARSIARAVQIAIQEQTLTVRIIITVRYGSQIPETTIQVQKKVKSTLETMTGLAVRDVHVSVADVALDKK